TKTPRPKPRQNSNQKNPITNKRHQKLASKNNNHTLNGKKSVAKNNKQKPPNTLLSSQTTGFSALPPCFGATPPA
ncbi:hypothetical protein, partial [Mycolicibacterium fortuitum]|uniref:hypothetical protein n=1 Tax=Mycolicibacterium fortuitum TaxID=1766 RepID=UPI001B7F917B